MSKSDKITEGFKNRSWQEIRSNDSWQIFKIMAEFVEAFEKMGKIGPCVSIFGSARTLPDNENYLLAEEIAKQLVHKGYGIISGGGPGIMEAANKGANLAGGKSVGLNILLPHEQFSNQYIDQDKLINFDYFFVRKVIFLKYAMGFVVLPGGLGTLDELFEALTLIQTEKIAKFPVVLVGKSYWAGLFDWIKNELLTRQGTISPEDLDLFIIVDKPEEAVDHIVSFYNKYLLKPNF
ncbi:MAG: hypothetical protein ACJATA_000203 [Sphingobacteriales bacterium]|jgi:uncharacterized protein (TIGR00730 family)